MSAKSQQNEALKGDPAPAETDAKQAASAAPEATEPPKRRRGRPPGSPKVPGSGRPPRPKTPAELRNHIIAELDKIEPLLEIAQRRQIRLSGPTGKSYLGYASVDQQLAAWRLLLAKALPDLAATQLDANVAATIEAPVSSRDMARAVLDILKTAHIEDAGELPVLDAKQQFNGVANERAVGNGAAGDADGKPAAAGPDAQWGFNAAAAVAAAEYDRQTMANRQVTPDDLYKAELEMRPDERSPAGFQGGLPDASGLVPGERVLVKDANDNEIAGWLEYRYTLGKGDERKSFWLCDQHGTRHASVLGRENAEAKLAELARTGKVTT